LPARVGEREVEGSVQAGSGRKRECWESCRTSRCCQKGRRGRDLHDLVRVPEVVSMGREGEREVEG
jgi:hypothetical protein